MIQLTTPVSVPAQTFTFVWIQKLFVDGSNPNNVVGTYTLRPATTNPDGSVTLGPGAINGRIDNLRATAEARAVAGKPALIDALVAVESALQEIETEKSTI